MLYGSEFKMKGFEMIKRIRNPVQGRAFRNDEEIVVPIIDNKCFETDLAARYNLVTNFLLFKLRFGTRATPSSSFNIHFSEDQE